MTTENFTAGLAADHWLDAWMSRHPACMAEGEEINHAVASSLLSDVESTSLADLDAAFADDLLDANACYSEVCRISGPHCHLPLNHAVSVAKINADISSTIIGA